MSQEPKRDISRKKKARSSSANTNSTASRNTTQKLPNWWLFTFYGAVVWFVVYWVMYYHTGMLKSSHELVTEKIVAIQQAKAAELEKTLASLDDSTLVHEWATAPEVVSAGEAVYLTNCTACHAADLSATMAAGTTTVPLPACHSTTASGNSAANPWRSSS